MEKRSRVFLLLLILMLFINGQLSGQAIKYEGPDDPAGDAAAERKGYMNGNRVLISFKNTTMMANWPNNGDSVWPNDYTGLGMIDHLAILIGAKVYIKDKNVPVDDINDIQHLVGLDTLYYVQTDYNEPIIDYNPNGDVKWALYPVFGYFNENSEYPAMSTKPESWPPAGWPSQGDELKWPGEWDGRFGKNIMYADLESYFVANDAQDQEYIGSNSIVNYYPRPDVLIGDKRPGVTIQKGKPWGGVGIRVKVRGYQWNNILARDAVFWEYDIANISDYNLTEAAFGYWMDTGIGHKGSECDQDDIGYFNKDEDLAYTWDYNGVSAGGLTPGILGMAFLESPGISDDGIDNDGDGLVDEKRDNEATMIIGATDGIDNLDKFLQYYNKTAEDLKPHWDADEDQDWQDGLDLNGNGTYAYQDDEGNWRLEEGEYTGDDMGLDGKGPLDTDYKGPDEGECDHKPNFKEGYGCEPNFALTDVSESDMIGLTSFHLYQNACDLDIVPRNDQECWNEFAEPGFVEYFGTISNLYQIFGSGIFPLDKGRTERVSISEIHSYENLSGLNSSGHSAPSLFEKKRIAQFIYESDYRFASPPEMPTLKAAAGDGKVVLTWDDVAEVFTREPLLGGKNDFEGYKLYKATDKYFSDAEVLVDMYGNPVGKKPIFQCDLKNDISGAADFVLMNGVAFYLGNNSGIQHYFVDEDVQNGRTYYYGITAYDYGIEGININIIPSENNLVIEIDEYENISYIGKNVQVVTPHQEAAGYVSPSIQLDDETSLLGTGTILPEVIDAQQVKPGNKYKVKFHTDTTYFRPIEMFRAKEEGYFTTNGFSVYDVTNGNSLIYSETPDRYPGNNLQYNSTEGYWYFESLISDPFDGIQLNIETIKEAVVDSVRTGWIIGDAPITVTPLKYEKEGIPEHYYFPYQYEIVFTGEDSSYTGRVNSKNFFDEDDKPKILLGQSFNFYVVNKMLPDSSGVYEMLDLIVYDENLNGIYDDSTDHILAGHCFQFLKTNIIYWGGTVFSIDFKDADANNNMPEAGDVYQIDFKRPFMPADSLIFTALPPVEMEEEKLKNDMDKIKVVPNPYIATNAMEPAVYNPYINQPRRIMFTHIPANCTIKIFTSSGAFIDEIKVMNPPDDGKVHWDMLTKEGLEIAAGIYLYHLKSDETGEEKLGKFAVIK